MKTKITAFFISFLFTTAMLAMLALPLSYLLPNRGVDENSNPSTIIPSTEMESTLSGSEKDRDIVSAGLEYLAKSQFADGHWEGDDGQHPVAMTGLIGIALLMEGSTAREGQYTANISKAMDWLIATSEQRDGLIFSGHPSETSRYMEGHGLATIFLAGCRRRIYDDPRRIKLDNVLGRAVKFIAKAQTSQGGWHHTSRVEGHDFATVLATAIQLQALQAVENTKSDIPFEALYDGQEFLRFTLEKADVGAGRDANATTETAAALACRFRHEAVVSHDEPTRKWFQRCRAEIPLGSEIQFGRDELMHYFYAQAVVGLSDESSRSLGFGNGTGHLSWKAYREAIFEHLQNSQNDDGSWPAGVGISVGPVYSTAIWCTILELNSYRHPSYEILMKPRRFPRDDP